MKEWVCLQEEDEVEELRDVYDSTPSPAIRQIRNVSGGAQNNV